MGSAGRLPTRRCLDCGTPTSHTRCPTCQRAYRARYNGPWRQTSINQRTTNPQCAWCGTTNDLCADHLTPGQPQHGVRTLCRGCNTRRRNGQPEPRGPHNLHP